MVDKQKALDALERLAAVKMDISLSEWMKLSSAIETALTVDASSRPSNGVSDSSGWQSKDDVKYALHKSAYQSKFRSNPLWHNKQYVDDWWANIRENGV